MNAKQMGRAALVGGVAVAVATGASATGIDITAVTGGISDAGTAILGVITALLAMSVTLFGLGKVYRFVSKKAPA